MSVQLIAETIINIGHQHRNNMMLKADINYMSSLMYNNMPYQQKGDHFQFESLDLSYLTETLLTLIDEEKELKKEKSKLFLEFDEEDYK
jgi:hypothetical protein